MVPTILLFMLMQVGSKADRPQMSVEKDRTVLVVPGDWKLNITNLNFSLDQETKTITISGGSPCTSPIYTLPYYPTCSTTPCISGTIIQSH